MKKWNYVVSWIPIGVTITLMSLMVFGAVQQTIRLGANEIPIQLAEDAAADIVRGMEPKQVLPHQNVDLSSSLAPFVIVYDDKGEMLASSVELDGKVPAIPPGLLNSARERKEDNVTWQPKPGVRASISVVRYVGDKPGFVLAGKSLREVELLEDKLLFDVIAGWAITMAFTLFASFFFRPR